MNHPATCNGCGAGLTPDNWYPSSQKSQLYLCNGCQNKRADNWRKNNPEKAKKWLTEWELLHPDYKHEYYLTHKEKLQEQNKRWGEANRGQVNSNHRRWYRNNTKKEKARKLKYKYGLSYDNYEQMLVSQANSCALCLKPFTDEFLRRPHVDHDHKTGAVRGLLCWNCNILLGKVEELGLDKFGRIIPYLHRIGSKCNSITQTFGEEQK